jgi:metal-responsive CopG/Arc/MetJ family transcriptional regulator
MRRMCQALHMRIRIELDDQLVAQIDKLSGRRGRSAFVRSAIERAIRQEFRWTDIEAANGAIENQDHEWDHDPAAWVREQRRADVRRAG